MAIIQFRSLNCGQRLRLFGLESLKENSKHCWLSNSKPCFVFLLLQNCKSCFYGVCTVTYKNDRAAISVSTIPFQDLQIIVNKDFTGCARPHPSFFYQVCGGD